MEQLIFLSADPSLIGRERERDARERERRDAREREREEMLEREREKRC